MESTLTKIRPAVRYSDVKREKPQLSKIDETWGSLGIFQHKTAAQSELPAWISTSHMFC